MNARSYCVIFSVVTLSYLHDRTKMSKQNLFSTYLLILSTLTSCRRLLRMVRPRTTQGFHVRRWCLAFAVVLKKRETKRKIITLEFICYRVYYFEMFLKNIPFFPFYRNIQITWVSFNGYNLFTTRWKTNGLRKAIVTSFLRPARSQSPTALRRENIADQGTEMAVFCTAGRLPLDLFEYYTALRRSSEIFVGIMWQGELRRIIDFVALPGNVKSFGILHRDFAVVEIRRPLRSATRIRRFVPLSVSRVAYCTNERTWIRE